MPGFNPDPASSSRLDDSVTIGMFPVMLKLGKIVERKKKQTIEYSATQFIRLHDLGFQVTQKFTWLAAVHLNGGRVPQMTYSESIKVRTYLNNVT